MTIHPKHTTLLATALLLLTAPPSSAQLTTTELDLIEDALVEDPQPELIDEVIEIGIDAVDEVETYLDDPEAEVKARSLQVLAGIDEVATEALADALQSTDLDLVQAALLLAAPRLSEPAIAIEYVANLTDASVADLQQQTVMVMLAMDADTRVAVADFAVPEMTTTLGQFDESALPNAAALLGKLAMPGEAPALNALASLRSDVATLADDHTRIRSEDAILFAEANLGDVQALDAFEDDVLNGDPATKRSRLSYLDQFEPTTRIIQLAITALDDTTELTRLSPVHRKRVCDIAADTVGRWYPDARADIGPPTNYQYTDTQRAAAKAWLEQAPTGSP